jgi:hypothetical protein
VSFPGGKARAGRDADYSPHLVPRSRISRSYNSSTPWRLYSGGGKDLLYFAVPRQDLEENMQKFICKI